MGQALELCESVLKARTNDLDCIDELRPRLAQDVLPAVCPSARAWCLNVFLWSVFLLNLPDLLPSSSSCDE